MNLLDFLTSLYVQLTILVFCFEILLPAFTIVFSVLQLVETNSSLSIFIVIFYVSAIISSMITWVCLYVKQKITWETKIWVRLLFIPIFLLAVYGTVLYVKTTKDAALVITALLIYAESVFCRLRMTYSWDNGRLVA